MFGECATMHVHTYIHSPLRLKALYKLLSELLINLLASTAGYISIKIFHSSFVPILVPNIHWKHNREPHTVPLVLEPILAFVFLALWGRHQHIPCFWTFDSDLWDG